MLKRHTYFSISGLLCILTVVIFSCRSNKQSTHPAWNTNLLLPLITTNLSINDIITDSLIQRNADSSIDLVYKSNLYSLNLDSQVAAIPDTTLQYDFKLDSLKLANHIIVDSISLGRVAENAGLLGSIIIAENNTYAVVPALNGISTSNYNVNATSFFQTASLKTGTLTVTLFNGFPVELSKIIFQITNQSDGTTVVQDTFTNLEPNTQQSQNINLAGKTVDGHLLARVIEMDSPGSNGNTVLIDTSNSLVATLSITNLSVYSATAIFPAQNVVDQSQDVSYAVKGGALLKKVIFRSGDLRIILKSTIQDSIHFNYQLPSATDASGNPINLNSVLPPAAPGSTSSYTEDFPLAGYTFDLTGPKKDTFNTFYNQLIARIDSTGQVENISVNDSLYVYYAILNVVPEYISGYLGRDTLNYGPATIPFSVFKNIKGGQLNLQNINIKLSVENGIGANGRVIVRRVNGVHTVNTSDVPLRGALINSNLNVPRATDKPLTPTVTNFSLTPSNSNVLNFIDNLPNQLKYNLSVYVNPNGNINNYNDFVYYTSPLNISMKMDLPLSLIAKNLELVDTVPFSLASTSTSKTSTDAIQSGVLTLIANNGFPMQANVQMYFLDANYNILDSLLTSTASIAPGHLNNNCIVVSPTQSKIPAAFNEQELNKIKMATHAIVKASFTTVPNSRCSDYIKIYSDYNLGIIITGQFNYYTGN